MAFLQQQTSTLDYHLRILPCYRDRTRLRSDCLAVLQGTPSLHPGSGPPPASVRTATPQPTLLFLVGTVPIYYRNHQYNIPVQIWFGDTYPMIPPTVFVVPTADMLIKPKHRHVDSAGMVYHPYISSWNPATNNLNQLIIHVAQAFGEDPPVRQKRADERQAPPLGQQVPQLSQMNLSSSLNPTPAPYPAASQPYPYPPNPSANPPTPSYPTSGPGSYPGSYPNQPYPANPYPQPPSSYPSYQPPPPDPAIAKRAELTRKLQADLERFNKETQLEIDALLAESQNAQAVRNNQDRERGMIERERTALQQQLADYDRRIQETTVWLDENDKIRSATSLDEITDPKDVLGKQLLDNVAEDATIEDMIYYLDRALLKAVIDVDQYLKEIRRLSREQFYCRATIKKIHLVQQSQRR